MKTQFIKAINNGEIVKTQAFVTDRGIYQIFLVRSEGFIYFYKYLNGKMVECCNLNELEGRAI